MNLTPQHIDAITELVNIGVGRAAGMLNDMLNAHVQLEVPSIKIFLNKDIEKEIGTFWKEKLSCIRMTFKGPFSGIATLIFPPTSASTLVDLLVGESEENSCIDSIRTGTLSEIGNIVLNGVMGSIGNILNNHFKFSVPNYMEETFPKFLSSNNPGPDSVIMIAHTHFKIKKHMIEGKVLMIFEVGSFNALIDSIDSSFQLSDSVSGKKI